MEEKQKHIITPDPISLTTHQLHMLFNDEVISSGTGFIYKKNKDYYLITNWHNVTGRHPETGECLSETKAIPNKISTMFRSKGNIGESHRETFFLYNDENMENGIWIEHPLHKQKVDVVAIRLSNKIVSKYNIYPINKVEFDAGYKPEVADEAFVVGYPFFKQLYINLPIWKKASIASEPDINIDQLPKMNVDTATRKGLSGSPVIMQRQGLHGMVDGKIKDDTILGRIRNFIEIYSGRIGNDEFKAQLGIVWKKKVLDEIIG